MLAMLGLFVATVMGGCHIDAGDSQCAAAEKHSGLILMLAPLLGIAAFFLVNGLIGRRG